jgi:hypothetical protein
MAYLKISYQIWTNEAVVEALELISNVVVSSFSNNVFESRHHVIDEAFMNSLVHGRLSLLSSLYIQNLHQRLDGDALQEHREINHANCRCHKQRLQFHMRRIDQQNEGKSNCSTQATIRHDKLIDFRKLVNSKFVCHVDEKYHTCEEVKCQRHGSSATNHQSLTNDSENRAENYCQENKPGVPSVVVVDRSNSQEHENNRFRGAAQHLQGIFYCCVGFVRYIGLHIIFHGYTTKSYSASESIFTWCTTGMPCRS